MSPIFIFVENAERSDYLWPLHDFSVDRGESRLILLR